MKKILFVLLGCVTVFGWSGRKVTLSASNTLGTTYAVNNQSLILSELSGSFKNVSFVTNVSDIACTHVGSGGSVTAPTIPTTGDLHEVYLIASEYRLMENVGAVKNIYCRSTSATKVAGELSAVAW